MKQGLTSPAPPPTFLNVGPYTSSVNAPLWQLFPLSIVRNLLTAVSFILWTLFSSIFSIVEELALHFPLVATTAARSLRLHS